MRKSHPEITPEVANEIIMRFYLSNRNWWISKDSRGYVCGILDAPRRHHEYLEEMLGDLDKGKHHFLTSRIKNEE